MKTTINGKEVKLFTRNDISVILTKIVNEYLSKGFVFAIDDKLRGSQGEEVKIDLTNDGGKTIHRVWLTSDFIDISNRVLIISVKKYLEDACWFSKGELVYQRKFYSINERIDEKGVFVEFESDYKSIRKIQYERARNKYDYDFIMIKLSESCKSVALKIIRKRKGYKTVKLDDIENIYHRLFYGYDFRFFDKASFSIKTVNQSYNNL